MSYSLWWWLSLRFVTSAFSDYYQSCVECNHYFKQMIFFCSYTRLTLIVNSPIITQSEKMLSWLTLNVNHSAFTWDSPGFCHERATVGRELRKISISRKATREPVKSTSAGGGGRGFQLSRTRRAVTIIGQSLGSLCCSAEVHLDFFCCAVRSRRISVVRTFPVNPPRTRITCPV